MDLVLKSCIFVSLIRIKKAKNHFSSFLFIYMKISSLTSQEILSIRQRYGLKDKCKISEAKHFLFKTKETVDCVILRNHEKCVAIYADKTTDELQVRPAFLKNETALPNLPKSAFVRKPITTNGFEFLTGKDIRNIRANTSHLGFKDLQEKCRIFLSNVYGRKAVVFNPYSSEHYAVFEDKTITRVYDFSPSVEGEVVEIAEFPFPSESEL